MIRKATLEAIAAVFQFPSNGKVLSDRNAFRATFNGEMFQFPSNGKVLSDEAATDTEIKTHKDSFNSLQTGKSFRTKYNRNYNRCISIMFQFPSNGKVLSDIKGKTA